MAGIRVMAAAAGILLLVVAVVARPPAKLKDSTCSTSDTYVYPYWSLCSSPAELSEGYHYVAIALEGGLEPEYDETNATYYVRLTGSVLNTGATYVAVVESGDSGTLLVDSAVYIYNAESKRALQWRQEGTDEYFLIEQEVTAVTEGAAFQFTLAEGIALPCPLIYPPVQCNAYYLVSYPSSSSASTSSGLLAYAEEGATYVKAADAGSKGDLPLVVRKSTSSVAWPLPTIRTVTAN